MKYLLSLIFLICVSGIAKAQPGHYKRIEIGVGAGGTLYSGDIHPYPRAAELKLGGEAFFRYNFTTYLSGRLYVEAGNFKGSFANSSDPTMTGYTYGFRGNYIGGGAVFEYNFFNFRGDRELYRTSPYVFAGVGVANHITRQFDNGEESGQQLPGIVPTIPFGVGVKYALSYRLNLALEFRTNKLFTDELDGLDSNVAGFNPAWNTKNDLYYFVGLSIAYRFISIRCPESADDYMR